KNNKLIFSIKILTMKWFEVDLYRGYLFILNSSKWVKEIKEFLKPAIKSIKGEIVNEKPF
ncbi:TPA: hypothetical protein ACSKNH_002830, partial [Listeria innocua]